MARQLDDSNTFIGVLRIMHFFEEQTVHKAKPGALLADLKNKQLLPHSLELARLDGRERGHS